MEIKEQDIFASTPDEQNPDSSGELVMAEEAVEVMPEKPDDPEIPEVLGSPELPEVEPMAEDDEPFVLEVETAAVKPRRRVPAPQSKAMPAEQEPTVVEAVREDTAIEEQEVESASQDGAFIEQPAEKELVAEPIRPTAEASEEEPIQPAIQPNPQDEAPKTGKKRRVNQTLSLFATFFKIGLFTFGGGYAMIPMIESEVVEKNKWIDKEQFIDLIAISQTCPGVFAVNISTFIGYKLKKTPGALFAAFGTALPSFLIILMIALVFRQFQDVPWVAACFRGIRPAVVALIAVPTFNLAKSAKINLMSCWIPIVSALLIYLFGVNPIFIIIAAAFGGYLYGSLIK